MNKKTIIFLLLGILFIITPYFIKEYTIFRFVLELIGIILFNIGIFLLWKKGKVIKFIFPVFLILLLYSLDFLSVYSLETIPIFSYEHKSDSFSTYDSFIYRIYNCQESKILDVLYKKNYVCENHLEVHDVNAFLSNISSNYKKYHSKFVTIKGKVSEVVGNDHITLQPYEQQENSLVGQISFNKNTSLVIKNNNNDLKFYGYYEIYDNVVVTGKIDSFANNTITLHDPKITLTNNFDSFTLNTIETKNCKNIQKELTKVGDYNYYSECLDKIFIKYDENTIYDIILALETKKITLEKLLKEGTKSENEEQELYKFSTYNLLKCKNTNTILIGSAKLKLSSKFCKLKQEEQTE